MILNKLKKKKEVKEEDIAQDAPVQEVQEEEKPSKKKKLFSKKKKEKEPDQKTGFEHTVDLNKAGYTLEEDRVLQLCALFHLLKMQLGHHAYRAILAEEETYYVPYSFSYEETVAMVQNCTFSVLYLELDEDNYVEIRQDQVKMVSTSEDLIQNMTSAVEIAKGYVLAVSIHIIRTDTQPNLWQGLLNNEYDYAMQIGEHVIKNGALFLYTVDGEEGEEKEIHGENPIVAKKGKIEFLVMRSLDRDKSVVFDHRTKSILCIGCNEPQQQAIHRLLQTKTIEG